ncbi:MAG: IS4 family transposase [Acidobacteria bacterium]|nr:IS4 family transposase [Acidobacteriota bacterium]
MRLPENDEWRVIETLLPAGWKEAARGQKAFQRARYLTEPAPLLRLLLFHAVNDGGLRETVAQARASGIARMSQVALLKRLRTSGLWLAWLGAELCRSLRQAPHLPQGLRPRAVDSTTVQGPASKGTEWRVHYSLDLITLNCDWYELTDAHGGERLERTPMQKGDVLLADRNYLRPAGARAAVDAGAHILVRLRWRHSPMHDERGRGFHALARAQRLNVGQIGGWPVRLLMPGGKPIWGRVVVTKLPAPLAAKAERRALKSSTKKGRKADPRSLQAAHFVMVFTTLPEALLTGRDVLELYRYRWQIELAFKRLKQLLKLGRLPHKDPRSARTWILAKLVVALLLETLYRNARAFSPWGYTFEAHSPFAA